MKYFLLLVILASAINLRAQNVNEKKHYYSFALSNSHTAKPFANFSQLFYKDFHPGFQMGYGTILPSLKTHQWFAEINLSYLFHRWVQQAIGISINGGYRRTILSSWSVTTKLGGGYQLSIPAGKIYRITDNGLKEKGTVMRSQFIGNLGFGVDKKITANGNRLFIEYQQRLQTPFIKEYVPLLPYNNLLIGLTVPVR